MRPAKPKGKVPDQIFCDVGLGTRDLQWMIQAQADAQARPKSLY
jgi:hypothetical protein